MTSAVLLASFRPMANVGRYWRRWLFLRQRVGGCERLAAAAAGTHALGMHCSDAVSIGYCRSDVGLAPATECWSFIAEYMVPSVTPTPRSLFLAAQAT